MKSPLIQWLVVISDNTPSKICRQTSVSNSYKFYSPPNSFRYCLIFHKQKCLDENHIISVPDVFPN